MDDARFDRAIAAFDAAHAEDPRTVDTAEGPLPYSVLYHRRMTHWLEQLAPDAGEALRLAARCQHIRRWTQPRSDYPQGRAGYKKWRAMLAIYHGDQAAAILGDAGYDGETITRVRELLQKRRLARDPEVQSLEDAICLVFLENEFVDFAAKHPDDKVVDIVAKTWAKMSPAGHQAALGLVPALPERLQALVVRAVSA